MHVRGWSLGWWDGGGAGTSPCQAGTSLGDAGHGQGQVGDWLEPLDGPVDLDLGRTREHARTHSGAQVQGPALVPAAGTGSQMCIKEMVPDPAPVTTAVAGKPLVLA